MKSPPGFGPYPKRENGKWWLIDDDAGYRREVNFSTRLRLGRDLVDSAHTEHLAVKHGPKEVPFGED